MIFIYLHSQFLNFTDRVRSTRREVMFSVCSHPGGGHDRVPPGQGWGNPPLPPPRDRTADGVLDTPWSVCLLRSRRTFLFMLFLFHTHQ